MTKATAKSKRNKLTSRMAPKEKGNDIFYPRDGWFHTNHITTEVQASMYLLNARLDNEAIYTVVH